MPIVFRTLPALAACVMAASATAQTAPAPPPTPCTTAEHRQFDFWLGDWVVHGGPDGTALQGTNRIERSGNGCWLVEHWRSAKGNDGTSLNAWDAQHRAWRQFWVGADGVVVRLQGGLRGDGAMEMSGELPKADGGVQLQEMSWTPAADGSVLQQWDTSDDDGKSWQTSFLGTYRRTPAAP